MPGKSKPESNHIQLDIFSIVQEPTLDEKATALNIRVSGGWYCTSEGWMDSITFKRLLERNVIGQNGDWVWQNL
jgi:hypothetical protein